MKIISVLNKIMLQVFLLLNNASVFAQNDIEMADVMRTDGKIYVVVAVLAVIFIGLAVYLFTLDKRISKMEREKNSK